MNSPIYKDFYYTASTASLEYYIVADGNIIFRGKAWCNPDTGLVKINVGDIIRDYLRFDLPDFRPLDDVVTKQEDAYKVFGLYNASGSKLDEYKVLFDWYGEWNGETKVLSNPINGVLDPRMKILWSVYGPNAYDVPMEDGPISVDSFFRLLTTNIVLGQDGGDYRIRWLTDYMPSNEWTVTIPGMIGFTYRDATFSGITVDIPRNDTLSAFTYDIYYHIHGQTFGPTHMIQNGGTFNIDDDPGGGGPNSGDTEHIDWDSSFPDSAFTYSADTWIAVTNLSSNGCDISFREDNMSLEPRIGHVWIFLYGNLVKTITVTQAGRYFRNMTPLIKIPPSGGEGDVTWETDIPFAALSYSSDTPYYTVSNFSPTGMTVGTTGINMNYGDITGTTAVYSGSTFLGSTQIRQEGMYFSLDENPMNINSWTGSYLCHWNTNIPPELISWQFDGEDISGSITDATQTGFTLNVHNISWYDKIAYVDFYFSGDTFLETLTVNLKGNLGFDIQNPGDVQIPGTPNYYISFQYAGDTSRIYDEDRGVWVPATEYTNYGTLYYNTGFYFTGSTPNVEISGTTYAKILPIQIDTGSHPYTKYLDFVIVNADPDVPIPIGETFYVNFYNMNGGVKEIVETHSLVVTSQIATSGKTGYNQLIPIALTDYANVYTVVLHGENTLPDGYDTSWISDLSTDLKARIFDYRNDGVKTFHWHSMVDSWGGPDSSFVLGIGWKITLTPSMYERPNVLTYAYTSGNTCTVNFSVMPNCMTIKELYDSLGYPPQSRVSGVTIDSGVGELVLDIDPYKTQTGSNRHTNRDSLKYINYNGTVSEFTELEKSFTYMNSDMQRISFTVHCTDGDYIWEPTPGWTQP